MHDYACDIALDSVTSLFLQSMIPPCRLLAVLSSTTASMWPEHVKSCICTVFQQAAQLEYTAVIFMQSSLKVAITREQSFSLQIHESKSKRTWLEGRCYSFRRIATVEQLQLEYTDRHRIPRAATPRGIIILQHTCTCMHALFYSLTCGIL